MIRCPSCKRNSPPAEAISQDGGVDVLTLAYPDYCVFCGKELTTLCPICDFRHPRDAKFCAATGVRIDEV